MSKRVIISTVVIGILVILSIWAFQVSSKMTNNYKQISNEENISDEQVNVEELSITETRNGEKFWEVYATSGHYDNAKNRAMLTDVKGNFYKANKVILSFDAPVGIYNEKIKEIKLSGGARVLTDQDIFVSAKELNWIGTNDQITATGKVKIKKSGDLLTTGDKSIFNTDFSNVKIIGNTQTNVYTKK